MQNPRQPRQGIPGVLQWKATRTILLAECQQRVGRDRTQKIRDGNLCTYNPRGQGMKR